MKKLLVLVLCLALSLGGWIQSNREHVVDKDYEGRVSVVGVGFMIESDKDYPYTGVKGTKKK